MRVSYVAASIAIKIKKKKFLLNSNSKLPRIALGVEDLNGRLVGSGDVADEAEVNEEPGRHRQEPQLEENVDPVHPADKKKKKNKILSSRSNTWCFRRSRRGSAARAVCPFSRYGESNWTLHRMGPFFTLLFTSRIACCFT